MSPELVSALASGLAALVVAASVFLTAWRTGRNVDRAASRLATKTEKQAAQADEKLDEIHVLVNSRLAEALAEIAWLKRRLGVNEPEEGAP